MKPSTSFQIRTVVLGLAILSFALLALIKHTPAQQQSTNTQQLDPTAWGSNHVGQPVPEFVSGGECLFCHRNTIGATWDKNPHGITVRQREDAPEFKDIFQGQPKLAAFSKEFECFMGSRHHVRFLKKSGYGKFSIADTHAILGTPPQVASWLNADKPTWDKEKFGNSCAGCHTTGVDSKAKTFAGVGLDCYVCHGNVNLEHTNDTSIIWLSKKKKDDAKAVTSICAQCHLREGKSKSTGLPYPNNFVAGDNLFQDFQVDFSKADDVSLNAGDRHIYRNVRDVVIFGKSVTCLNCHAVHDHSSRKHRLIAKSQICSDCHDTEKNIYKPAKSYTVKSSLCEY